MNKENTFHFYGLLIKVLNTLPEVEVDIEEPVTVNWPIIWFVMQCFANYCAANQITRMRLGRIQGEAKIRYL